MYIVVKRITSIGKMNSLEECIVSRQGGDVMFESVLGNEGGIVGIGYEYTKGKGYYLTVVSTKKCSENVNMIDGVNRVGRYDPVTEQHNFVNGTYYPTKLLFLGHLLDVMKALQFRSTEPIVSKNLLEIPWAENPEFEDQVFE